MTTQITNLGHFFYDSRRLSVSFIVNHIHTH